MSMDAPTISDIASAGRQKKRKNPEQFKYLMGLCQNFLAAEIPESNIVLDVDFTKFIPLFTTGDVKRMDADAINALATEYQGRFSTRHPIKILAATIVDKTDPTAVYYHGDKQYHKCTIVLPPLFRQLRTLNDLGEKMPSLIDAFAHTATNRENSLFGNIDYGAELIRAMKLANPEAAHKEDIDKSQRIEDEFRRQQQEDRETPPAADGETSPSESPTPKSNNSQRETISTTPSSFDWD